MHSKRLLAAVLVVSFCIGSAGAAYALNPQPEPPNRSGGKLIKRGNPGDPAKMRSHKQRKVPPVTPGFAPRR